MWIITEIILIVVITIMWLWFRNDNELAMQRLKKKESDWLNIISESWHCIAIVDNCLESGQELKYIVASKAWRETFEFPVDYIGRSHYNLFPDIPSSWKKDHAKCILLNKCSRSATPEPFDFKGRRKYLTWSIQPWGLDSKGRVKGLVLQCSDVTEHLRSESRMGFLVEQNNTILGLLGHQINSKIRELYQLTNLDLFICKDGCGEDLIRENYEKIRTVCRSVKELTTAITNLRNIDKANGATDCNVYNLIIEAFESVGIKNYHVTEFECILRVSKTLIREVFIEILTNSLKNKHPDRDLVVDVAYCLIGNRKKDFLVSFTDNGIGIECNKIENLFTPFYRVRSDTPGTGLGLCIVKQILIKYDADITIESRYGEYTQVDIVFKSVDME